MYNSKSMIIRLMLPFFIITLVAPMLFVPGKGIMADDNPGTGAIPAAIAWQTGTISYWPDSFWARPILEGNGIAAHSDRTDLLGFGSVVNERIVFTRWGQVGIMDTNGSNLSLLTTGYEPALSPDGTKIAFIRYIEGSSDVFLMNSDGSNVTRLTENSTQDSLPVWAPDNSKIIFISYGNGITGISSVNPDGTGEILLTDTTYNISPDWSPNGLKIVYENFGQIFTMDPDGANKTAVPNTLNGKNARWSPDNLRIVFESIMSGSREIYVVNANGSNPTRLTNNSAYDCYPRWSPDGSKVVFASTRDGNWEIYVMNADGSGQTRLTNNSAYDFVPRWLKNGTDIIFNSIADNKEIYKVSTDGTNLTNLTNNPNRDELPYYVCSLQKPVGVTQDPTDVTSNSATLHGNLPDMIGESSVEVFFIYSTDPDKTFLGRGGIETPHQFLTSPGEFHANISGLLGDTKYYYRAWDRSITEISCSSGEADFTTSHQQGDADGDGKTGIGDILIVELIMLNQSGANPLADVDGDGKTGIGDILMIELLMLGYIT
jgi:hypothetical protein